MYELVLLHTCELPSQPFPFLMKYFFTQLRLLTYFKFGLWELAFARLICPYNPWNVALHFHIIFGFVYLYSISGISLSTPPQEILHRENRI